MQKKSLDTANSITLRRGAAAERNELQQRQRLATRAKLLVAASAVFKKKTYAATVVKDILHEAQISRGAFYGHFSGKYGVVEALFEGIVPSLNNVFEQLGSLKRLDQAHVERWLEKLLAVYEKNKDLFAIMENAWSTEIAINKDSRMGPWDRIVENVGMKIPSFALAGTDTLLGREARFRLTMLLSTIGFFCHVESVHHPKYFRDTGIKVVAEEVLRFINFGEKTSPAQKRKQQ